MIIPQVKESAGTHVMLGGGTVMPRGGLGSYAVEGLFYAHVMLLLWGATSCVGWE